jgi:hypothetical protein
MNEEDCKFDKIHLVYQKIEKHQIQSMLETIYNTIYFSTFPYLIYKSNSSLHSLHQYNSGNCIAFAECVKLYLKKNYNIESYIVGSSICSLFKVPGTPEICHCAVVVPLNLYEFYIVDSALYLLEPMHCSLKDNKLMRVYSSNCYEHEKSEIQYQVTTCESCLLDSKYNQVLPDKTLCVQASFTNSPQETWNYYLAELKNPDANIGYSFLTHKPNPFMMCTKYEDNLVKLKYKITYEDEKIVIKTYPDRKVIYEGNTYDNNEVLKKVFQELHPYFDDYII